jgi:hypothetical protein
VAMRMARLMTARGDPDTDEGGGDRAAGSRCKTFSGAGSIIFSPNHDREPVHVCP